MIARNMDIIILKDRHSRRFLKDFEFEKISG